MIESQLVQVVTPLGLFLVMLGVGLSLTPEDFSRILKYPKAVVVGLIGQHVVLPLAGFLVAFVCVSRPDFAIGIVLLSACPGGITSNLMTLLARGDLALSVSLTAVSSVIGFITVPVILAVAFKTFGVASKTLDFPVERTALALFLMTILPVLLGMTVRYFHSSIALRAEKYTSKFAVIFLIFLVITVTIEQRSVLASALLSVGVAALLLNVFTMAAGLGLSRSVGLDDRQSVSVCLEVGIQNSALAMVLAATVLTNAAYAIPSAVYSLVMYMTSIFVIVYRRYSGTDNLNMVDS